MVEKLKRAHQKEFAVKGVNVHAEVSPCCYMYKGYPLQLTITGPDMGRIILCNKNILFEDATVADFDAICERVELEPCCNEGCDNLRFAVTDNPHNNRAGQCETCFLAKLTAELEADQEKQRKKEEKREEGLYAEGYRFKISAWIHPKAGGGDYEIVFYSKERLSDSDIKKRLRKKSSVDSNFKVYAMEEPKKAASGRFAGKS